MEKKRSPFTNKFRLLVLALLVTALFIACGLRLMNLQIVRGEAFIDEMNTKTTTTTTIQAARGDIVDRYGRVLATTETAYHVVFDYAFIKKSELNDRIAATLEILNGAGEVWNSDLPIVYDGGRYRFLSGMEEEAEKLRSLLELSSDADEQECMQALFERYDINTETLFGSHPVVYQDGEYHFSNISQSKLNSFKKELGLSGEASAANCVARMMETPEEYFIYEEQTAFELAAVRYTMLRREFSVYNQYTFADDISTETVITIQEQNYRLSGVNISEVPTRVYKNGDTATHIIGSIGPIYAEEYDDLSEQGYAMNDIVGKSGVESALESQLRGQNGVVAVTQNKNGDIIQTETVTEAETGQTVSLTIDAKLQAELQTLLADFVSTASSGAYQSKGGAIVVLDVKTGEVIAAVNSSNYTMEEYKTNYSGLLEEDTQPLFNRALDGLYRPGSTLKPMMSAAALTEGYLGATERLQCTSPYKYGFSCLQVSHGNYASFDVRYALYYSCNTFYYQLSERMGIDVMQQYASLMGLGVDTGLEIKSANGRFAGKETTESLGGTWNEVGDTMQAAIGQSETAVTPLQMACEAMTIANKGTRYETHIVSSTEDVYGNETVTEPVVASEFEMSDEAYDAISEGMRLASTRTTGEYSLSNLGYDVAQKTGTAQTTSADRVNNAFIGYLPIDEPEIAISCIIEDLDTGASVLMRKIIDAYYECKAEGEEILRQNNQ